MKVTSRVVRLGVTLNREKAGRDTARKVRNDPVRARCTPARNNDVQVQPRLPTTRPIAPELLRQALFRQRSFEPQSVQPLDQLRRVDRREVFAAKTA